MTDRPRDVDNWTARLCTNTPLTLDQASGLVDKIQAHVRRTWGYAPREIVDPIVEKIVAQELAEFEPPVTFRARVSLAIETTPTDTRTDPDA